MNLRTDSKARNGVAGAALLFSLWSPSLGHRWRAVGFGVLVGSLLLTMVLEIVWPLKALPELPGKSAWSVLAVLWWLAFLSLLIFGTPLEVIPFLLVVIG